MVLLSALLAVSVSNATEFHVRPVADCSLSGDGSSAACASSTGAAGAFRGFSAINWASIQPGDTLFIIGQHNEPLLVGKSGTAQLSITFRGDKRGAAAGRINGGNTISFCVRDNNNRYLTFLNMEVSNCLNRGFHFDNGRGVSTVNPSGVVISNVNVHDIAGGTSFPTCIWGYGHDVLIQNSRIANCGDDGIWWTGSYVKVINNVISGVGIGPDETGDCVQLAGGATQYIVKKNHCDHLASNEKQCFNTATDTAHVYDPAAGGQVVENTCVLPPYDGVHSTEGIAADQPKAVVARNFVTGGRYGIYSRAPYVIGNVVTQFAKRGIQLFGRADTPAVVINNTVLAVSGENQLVAPEACILVQDGAGQLANNIVSGCNWGMAAFGYSANNWEHNLSWQNTADYHFGGPSNSDTMGTISHADPSFLGADPNNPYSWGIATAVPGTDISSYTNPLYGADAFRFDYNKNPRPTNAPAIGAFEAGSQ